MSEPDEAPVRGFADAINRRDPEAAVAISHPEIEFHSVLAVGGGDYQGHEGMRQYFADVASVWEEWRVDVHHVSPAPDGRVVIVMTMHARGKGSGAAWSELTAHLWTVRDGKLLRNEPIRDAEEVRRLGEIG